MKKNAIPAQMKEIEAEDAADFVNNGDCVAFGGFTPAGSPKVVAPAIAEKAEAEHAAGRQFQIRLLAGASTGDSIDGALTRAKAVSMRTPYQTNGDMREAINRGEIHYWDMHISHFAQQVQQGIFGEIDLAVVEAADISESGEIVLTSGIGMAPEFCKYAKKIIIELNEYHPQKIRGLHDIYNVDLAPGTQPIPLLTVRDRIGTETVKVDPAKIIGVIKTNMPDQGRPLADADEETDRIGENVARFLTDEMRSGRIPKQFLPMQSGVGNIANAVLQAMSAAPSIPTYTMYSEVLQDSVIEAIKSGGISFASGTALAVTDSYLAEIYANYDFFKTRLILRPEGISNHPEVALRLGLIGINTALEADIGGNVNSTHALGTKVMNGIGGSGDFARNSRISIFCCKSTAKDGKISAIVPICSHVDHTEHSVKILITEQGIADLRGKDPRQRARLIIDNCAHPAYRDLLRQYLSLANKGHQPLSLANAFRMHEAFLTQGDMHQTTWRAE